ncbi:MULTISPECIES: hypothetical protein [unclassified Streptomyces]|uniref:hypothetical protein n=1 Tax=unclassified Streptomyces TaxID=2593676 RepID=UPI002DDAFFA0|nr:hypothetical protein [Streptomyces sp. NBC_01750]WSB04633.1 hypothetical protein OIE54_38585 [Streptomyces sp. NBC_01794]WSD31085.1 hypothetical protein OG966_03535 [Streptomyces sp. NBC_01750]
MTRRYRAAKRYAGAFDREDSEDLGRRAPLIGLFPLRLLRALRKRRAESGTRSAS